MCCQYGVDGIKIQTQGYDCLQIPGASKAADAVLVAPKLCGTNVGIFTAAAAAGSAGATVCCK